MTRINVIQPRHLIDQHLLGEYNEIRRPINLALRWWPQNPQQLPQQYIMGAGHVRFFYNKLGWIEQRFEAIKEEMRRRNWNPRGEIDREIPLLLRGDWNPRERDILISIQRLHQSLQRIGKPRYEGRPIATDWYDVVGKGYVSHIRTPA